MKIRLLIFGVLTLVSILPVAILGYWQYRVFEDGKLSLSSDQQQLASQLTAFTESFTQSAITITLLGIILALITGWWLAGIIVKPLREFENTARSVSGGNVSPGASVSTKFEPQEIQDLSKTLAQMKKDVAKKYAELNSARESAENTNQARSNFLASMSHELRTPITSILGFSELLSLNKLVPLTTEQETQVNNINTSGHHLMKLISQILDLSAIDAKILHTTLDAVNTSEVIRQCIEITKPGATERTVSIVNNTLIENLPVIRVDATQLKQVILDLLSNAVKHSQMPGIVTINTAVTTNRMLRISISDTGPGISKTDQKKIYMAYESIRDISGNSDETNFGLAISKQLIESMNGNFGFESEIGKGSTFWISLPIIEGVNMRSEADIKPESSPQRPQIPVSADQVKRVLYIEDNPLNTQLMEIIFESVPNAVLTTAMTGEAGVKLANEISPDLILMDIFLPGIDGIEAARLLKDPSKTSDIPIIAISAASWDVDVERARDVGFFAYLTKPINIPETLSTIQKALQQSS